MPCNNFQNCVGQEKQNMRYPIDLKSLYSHRLYDNHAARTRCYARNPINILEGFGAPLTLEKLIKWVLVLLLIVLVVLFAKDFFMPKEQVELAIPEASVIEMTPITAAQE